MAQRTGTYRGRPTWSGYDVAQVCLNGHVTNSMTEARPLHSVDFCAACGSRTLTKCESCSAPIRGEYHSRIQALYKAPAYCIKCGLPFPWTAARVEAAKSLAEASDLTEHEQLQLASSIQDVMTDTPKTEVASLRIRGLLAKAGKEVGSALRKVIVDVASEAAKKIIFGP